MVRVIRASLAALLLAAMAGVAVAADAPPAGAWKVILPEQNPTRPFFLVKLESKDGKWSGTVTQAERLPKTTIDKIVVSGDLLRFTLKLEDESLPVEVKLPKEGDKMLGTAQLGKQVTAVRLERTTLASLDSYEIDKEVVAQPVGTPEVVRAALSLLESAGDKKAKPEEVRAWADKAVKTAEMHGPRWHQQTVLAIAATLSEQEPFANIAVTYARQAERQLDPKAKASVQKRVLETLATALEKAGKADDAKEVKARIAKIDVSLKPEPFAGRKGKSDRAVLVELFTGAQCPPCVAADMAFDALGKAFKPSEVILLQYHLHVPRPDPLTNSDTVSRSRFYGPAIRGTPTILFNGAPAAQGGGGPDEAEEKYEEYFGVVEPLLEKPAGAKIKLTATQKDGKIDISAEVSDVVKPADELRLRLVLVEESVNYTGTNKLEVHHNVVRAFPGGTEGTALKEKTTKKAVTVDLEELKKSTNEYLDKFAEKNPFLNKDRPLELKKLKVVAFVQNDDDGEILQAVQVDVK